MYEIVAIGFITLIAVIGYKFVVTPLLQVNKQRIVQNAIGEIMKKNGLSFEDARDKLLAQKIAKVVEVENYNYEIGLKKIKLGDRISFYNTDLKTYTVGDFVGTKNSSAEGYTVHMCIRTNDNKIKFFPVEIIDVETLKIYER